MMFMIITINSCCINLLSIDIYIFSLKLHEKQRNKRRIKKSVEIKNNVPACLEMKRSIDIHFKIF